MIIGRKVLIALIIVATLIGGGYKKGRVDEKRIGESKQLTQENKAEDERVTFQKERTSLLKQLNEERNVQKEAEYEALQVDIAECDIEHFNQLLNNVYPKR